MILAIVSTISYDPLGYLPLNMKDDAALLNVSRRVNFFPTLGGGIVADDAGSSHGDRTFTLEIKPKDRLEAEQIQYLTLMHSRFYLATRNGLFLVVPVAPDYSETTVRWTLRVLEKEA